MVAVDFPETSTLSTNDENGAIEFEIDWADFVENNGAARVAELATGALYTLGYNKAGSHKDRADMSPAERGNIIRKAWQSMVDGDYSWGAGGASVSEFEESVRHLTAIAFRKSGMAKADSVKAAREPARFLVLAKRVEPKANKARIEELATEMAEATHNKARELIS